MSESSTPKSTELEHRVKVLEEKVIALALLLRRQLRYPVSVDGHKALAAIEESRPWSDIHLEMIRG